MTNERGDRGGRKVGNGEKSTTREPSRPIRDNVKKSDNTVSFDRPTPQKPTKD
jgi:hypothetical protein